MRRLSVLFVAASLLTLSACRTTPVADAPAPSPAPAATPAAMPATMPGPPAHDGLNAALWFQTSAERDQSYRQVYRAATAQLDAALRDRSWDAMPRGERDNDPRGLPPAIIVDIDETVLDNSPYSARQVRDGHEYTSATWNAWVQQPLQGRPAARALPGAVAFAQEARTRGVTIFYISNRNADTAEATLLALRGAGFVLEPGQFLGKGTPTPGCTQPSADDKRCRRALVAKGHRVLMLMGDQLSDFLSETGDPAHRRALADGYADWFGQRWWMLPNPMYGAWESATWAGRPDRPSSGEARAIKRNALDPAE